MKNTRLIRVLSILTVLAILISGTALADSFSAIGKAGGIRIYRDAGLTSYWGTMPANSVVTVLSYSGNVAYVSNRGYTAFAPVEDMNAVPVVAKRAIVFTDSLVFEHPDLDSNRVAVPQGLEVYVLAVQGSCAAVERNGYVGFMYTGHLLIEGDTSSAQAAAEAAAAQAAAEAAAAQAAAEAAAAQAAAEAQAEQQRRNPGAPASMEAAFESGSYSNEELIYAFAVNVIGYSPAAACGLLANIKAESGFRPNATGDSGTSVGICQWHAGRMTRLQNWCSSNGFDAATLLGQLYYLKYELENYYPKVHNYLLAVSNDMTGCYNAGYYFCYNFEAPANRASKSDTRGNTAVSTYYPKYASV